MPTRRKPRNALADRDAAGGIALLIVDMISDWTFPDADKLLPPSAAVAPHIAAFKARCRRAGVPVIYGNDNRGQWRSDFRDVVERSLAAGGPVRRITELLLPDDGRLLRAQAQALGLLRGIALVPLQVVFGDSTFLDRVELKPEDFYRRLQAASELPTTSQPTPAAFIQAFRDALREANEVVAVLLGSNLSGTFASAQAAIRADNLSGVHLVDTRLASLGVGLLALRGAELAALGWRGAQIASELTRLRSRSGMILTVDRYDNLLRSGRISRGKAWLAGMLDVKPILSFDDQGHVVPVERVRGRENLEARALALLEQRLTPRPQRVRFGVAHADAPEAAERIRSVLIQTYRPQDCFVTLATGVLGTHVGPGAWGIFYQVEDGGPVTTPVDSPADQRGPRQE